ncbi:MAG: sigma-70 family RNA polymerase sigma factor [Phreatobacter sp.]|uniref:RNA polymerase sigma factor n=1 Tax=Phreatobacter sp. TaxID=1966341 RepID=UPI001A47DB98|nr:sigma-70 family RNA polymerase sigma factor [Phreatobacter sp.]MBL8569920.1 sigma-70 family RNA polymerase sigma factor [Phreatobacter sp.]
MAVAVSAATFEAARLGDQDAIAQLIDLALPDIRRYARRACRTSADAEDAAQEALWLLARKVGAIRSLQAISAWLFAVVRRECQRLARLAGIGAADATVPDEARLDRSDADLRLDLAAAIEALPQGYRDIVLLRDVRELTIDEIAGALGLTRQATKARLHRARLLLREYLVI